MRPLKNGAFRLLCIECERLEVNDISRQIPIDSNKLEHEQKREKRLYIIDCIFRI